MRQKWRDAIEEGEALSTLSMLQRTAGLASVEQGKEEQQEDAVIPRKAFMASLRGQVALQAGKWRGFHHGGEEEGDERPPAPRTAEVAEAGGLEGGRDADQGCGFVDRRALLARLRGQVEQQLKRRAERRPVEESGGAAVSREEAFSVNKRRRFLR